MRVHWGVLVAIGLALGSPAPAIAQGFVGGGASRGAGAAWEAEGAYSVVWIEEGAFADTDAGPGVGGGPGVFTYRVRCEAQTDTLVEEVRFGLEGLTGELDPALGGAAVRGTAVAEGLELRSPGCEEPDPEAGTERELDPEPLSVDARVVADGEPQHGELLLTGGDPSCFGGVAGVDVFRTGSATATLGGQPLGPTQDAAAYAGGVLYGGGCLPVGDRDALLARARAAVLG